jgi:Flp pilus assembly protein CpaB
VSRLSPGPLLRRLARHRAPLAAALVALAVASGLSAVAPADAAAVTVVAAAGDLAAGTVLADAELTTVRLPPDAVPTGALRAVDDARGQRLAGAVRAGEALTDVRLLGPGLLPPGGDVAVPVRVAEPAVAGLLRPGDRVDVLAAAPEGGEAARTVVSDVVVLAVPSLDEGGLDGALLVLAATTGGASRLAAAAVSGRLSVAVRGR